MSKNEISSQVIINVCNENCGIDIPHPQMFDLERARSLIPHTIGEHEPDEDGKLLCNGHCDWEDCDMGKSICRNCGYAECWYCTLEFHDKLIDLGIIDKSLKEFNNMFCRGCGYHVPKTPVIRDCLDAMHWGLIR